MFDINTNEGYFIHLIKCAIKNEQPVEASSDIDFSKIFQLSLRHDVENLTFLSVQRLKKQIDNALFEAWQEVYYKDKKRCLFQDMALEELVDAFTQRGIDCMPLKGSVVKHYYPSPDLRSMSDIDFLVREQDRSVVRDIMHDLGYADDILDDGQVDAFTRETLIYIEIHYDFSAENHVYHNLFTIDWSKLVPTKREHLYEMTFEDLYFFNVGHYAKNMHNKGMGLRGIVDGYVLWNVMNDEQKQNVINRFAKTELAEFHNNLLKIADIWFNGFDDDGSLDDVQNYLLIKKTYGDYKTETALRAMFENKDSSNFKFVLSKIFPSAEVLYRRFGIKKKCFLILPFLWLWRIFIQLFGNKEKWENARLQLDTFESVDQADIDYERKIREQFGLI